MSFADSLDHIHKVQVRIGQVIGLLTGRYNGHDASKLIEPELTGYDKLHEELTPIPYGSPAYAAKMAEFKWLLDHHFAHNDHHPEFTFASEEWRDAPAFDGTHEVSNIGRVRSKERRVTRIGTRGDMIVRPKIIKMHETPKGYLRLQLSKDGGHANVLVHVLVALAFIGQRPNEKSQVNHKNGIKTDNRAENLEWVSPSENLQHAYDNGLKEPNAKYLYLCDELELAAVGGEKMAVLCRKAGFDKVSPAGIWHAANGDAETHHGLSFRAIPLEPAIEVNGVAGMTLMSLVEMLADWKAASERPQSKSPFSLEWNIERFKIEPQLASILRNTARELGWLLDTGDAD